MTIWTPGGNTKPLVDVDAEMLRTKRRMATGNVMQRRVYASIKADFQAMEVEVALFRRWYPGLKPVVRHGYFQTMGWT